MCRSVGRHLLFTQHLVAQRLDGATGAHPVGGPVKRSVMIAGHATSISLEPVFWDALGREAAAAGVPLSALVARIDAARVLSSHPSNLASSIRVWLFEKVQNQAS